MSHSLIKTFLLLLLPTFMFAQNKKYEVASEITNIEGDKIYFTIWDGSSATRNLSLTAVNQQIQHLDTLSGPLVIRASVGNKSVLKMAKSGGYYPSKASSIWFVAEPGAKVKLTGKLTDYAEVYPAGGKENAAMVKITKAYFPVLNQAMNLTLKKEYDSTLSAEGQKALNAEIETLSNKALEVLKSGITNNASSIAALYFANDLMLRRQMTIEEGAALLKKVNKSYQNTLYYQTIQRRIDAGNYPVGAKMFEIKSQLSDGGNFSSNSLAGKFYLIDFWGNWCGPCMAGMPNLKMLKEKYAGKLEILGIDKGDTETVWKNTIKNKELNWLHIMNGNDDQDYVARLNVTGFPTKILIGPDGKILYRTTGENADFNEQIEKHMNAASK